MSHQFAYMCFATSSMSCIKYYILGLKGFVRLSHGCQKSFYTVGHIYPTLEGKWVRPVELHASVKKLNHELNTTDFNSTSQFFYTIKKCC